ncbi:MAG: UDP-N-acetylglucosamine 4,6-dehydratase (inverting) [Colwellia sp.]|nr:UDP-N-acetylglucosamine 4,6-dehydratase (inverting) [Colwellia sp.]
MLNGKSILITGATGSFGNKFVGTILANYPDIKRLVIFSRDELKQFEMSQVFSPQEYPCLRYFIGDVRDQPRLIRACEGIDIIVHAAALKQVPAAEYNPTEFIKTNVLGAENVIAAAIANNVERLVALSTDKAAAPINLYGATKLCSDKLFVAANNITGKLGIMKFSVVRYGNVMGSRGSVIPFFLDKKASGVLPITHPDMTRFNITLEESVDLVLYAIDNARGGEIFIPKIPSYVITDLVKAIGPDCEVPIIGIRPGEKLHEEMIAAADSYMTLDIGKHLVMIPFYYPDVREYYLSELNATPYPEGESYNSKDNQKKLSVDDLRKLIKEQIAPDFTI